MGLARQVVRAEAEGLAGFGALAEDLLRVRNLASQPLVLGLQVLAGVTAGKWFINELGEGLDDLYNGPAARTAQDAATKGRMVARFKIEPTTLRCEGKVYEFQEAWLAAAYVGGSVAAGLLGVWLALKLSGGRIV